MQPGEQPGAGSATPELRPPGHLSDPAASTAGSHRWVWFALVAVVLLGLVVIFVLPRMVSEHPVPVRDEAATVQPPPVPASRDNTVARTTAEQTLQVYLQLRARLELDQAGVWGEPGWSQAADEASAGDRLFGQRQFQAAAQTYTTALHMLEALTGGRERQLAAAIEAGQRALAADDAETARARFERALAIEPDHESARHGLERARVRGVVLQRMAAGRDAEDREDLEAARTAYLEVTQLDAEYTAAGEALKRVMEQLAASAYRAAMSRALAALDADRLGEAGTALEEANKLKPADSAVQDARQRLVRARQQARLTGLRRQAATKVQAEDWPAAVALYQQALAVDAGAGFAREGLTRAQDRVRLHRQLDHYLTDPARLYSPEPLANAGQLLTAAGNAPGSEPRLAKKIATLTGLVTGARTPLPVTLRSDGETEVVIYHVARLGQFHTRQLELRPGTYTAVGSRPGYRDARIVFRVQPGASPPPVEIRCEELI